MSRLVKCVTGLNGSAKHIWILLRNLWSHKKYVWECPLDTNVRDALGVDRWLASLAAWTLSRGSVCVVDVGTALTVDVVVANGEHVGGLIAPGPDMLKASLVSGTAGIEIDQFSAADRFGINTVEAISLGCRSALKGVLREVEQQLDMLGISETTSWYLTGGAADVVKELIPNKHIDNPRLVLEGLVALGLHVD